MNIVIFWSTPYSLKSILPSYLLMKRYRHGILRLISNNSVKPLFIKAIAIDGLPFGVAVHIPPFVFPREAGVFIVVVVGFNLENVLVLGAFCSLNNVIVLGLEKCFIRQGSALMVTQ